MIRVSTVADLRGSLAEASAGRTPLGFVPTMGALHRGHLSLVEHARQRADLVVMSIFVNPRQFGPNEDFARYPRPIEQDEQMAADSGVDVLFTPRASEIFPVTQGVAISSGNAARRWEGEARPGHFDGMLTVVAKLFNLVRPDFAVFGQKDLQQAALVAAMVRDLNMPLGIVIAPTVRESDGLAMSSRNRLLAPADREKARVLSRALSAATSSFRDGERDPRAIESAGRAVLAGEPAVLPDYFAVVDRTTLEPAMRDSAGDWAVVTAARVGATRLIDNMLLGDSDAD